MVARVTLADIDTLRISIEEAVERFRELVVPPLRDEPGYRGLYALTTPEGQALVMTLWESEAEAEAGLASGFYARQLEQFVTFYRAAPGRTHYEVVVEDRPG
jgi:heme-degrading monooxygenase HmoA